jgi:hypothetical protein
VRDVWASPLWIYESASEGRYTRAAVREPKDPPVFGEVPGIGHVRVFPQIDSSCPLTHWDRWIDADGVTYEDRRGAGRTYFMVMPDGRAIGGPLDDGPDCRPEPHAGYREEARDGVIWVMRR